MQNGICAKMLARTLLCHFSGCYNEAMYKKLNEKCAVVGVSTSQPGTEAAQITYQALFALQHRGVEGSGIATFDSTLHQVRRPGMVRDVYQEADIASLCGKIAVGHNRYSTNGDKLAHQQPVLSPDIGFALAHNGNLPDTRALEGYLTKRRYLASDFNDSEMLGKTISSKLHSGRSIELAVRDIMKMTKGAYACTGLYKDTLFAFRDPYGVRPLEIGEFPDGIVVASETCALDTVGAKHLRAVNPGELVIIQNGTIVESIQIAKARPKLDIFEFVYFARHDSYMYGRCVDQVRRDFGAQLARLHPPIQSDTTDVVVVPVPDTSVPASEGYADALGLRHETAIIKNRYVGRTFMQPSQNARRSNLRLKHTMIAERIKGRDVYLIDDSIVRGNTLPRLVELARHLQAKSVSVLIASPPVRYPDYYGIDTPEQSELMAAQLTVEQMRKSVKADYLGFLSISAMVEATGVDMNQFCLAAFNGEYPVPITGHESEIAEPVSREFMD